MRSKKWAVWFITQLQSGTQQRASAQGWTIKSNTSTSPAGLSYNVQRSYKWYIIHHLLVTWAWIYTYTMNFIKLTHPSHTDNVTFVWPNPWLKLKCIGLGNFINGRSVFMHDCHTWQLWWKCDSKSTAALMPWQTIARTCFQMEALCVWVLCSFLTD